MKTWPNNYEALKSGAGFGSNSGTVTSGLYLAGNPVQDLEAAPKQYVDSITESIPANKVSSGTFKIERLPAYSGEVVSAQGTGILSLVPTGVTAGTYTRLSVASSGRVNSGSTLQSSDIPNIPWSKITSNKPTSLEGYGVADAIAKQGGVLSGYLSTSGTASQPLHAVTKGYVDDLSDDASAIKTGGIIESSLQTIPAGYLRCNGALASKTAYPALYAIFGDNVSIQTNTLAGSGQPWRQQYEFNATQSADVTGWATGTSLPAALSNSHAIVTKDRVYLLGGRNGSTHHSTVYTAPIDADGTLGGWKTGTSLPGILSGSQVIVTKERTYLLGGRSGSTYVSTVYTAPINADGTLGAWTTGTSLPGPLTGSQAIITKNRAYLLGGYNGSSDVSTVYTAVINADGTLGSWTTGTSLPGPLNNSQAIVTKDRVYLLGGVVAFSSVSTVYTAPINTDGTLGTWTTGTSLPGSLYASQSIVAKNRVYLLGGYSSGGSVVSTVYTAPVNADGTLGTWTTGTSLPGPLTGSQAIITKNRAYLLGGVGTSTVYVAPFSGGLNDYSTFYTTGYTAVDPDNFKLPDYTSLETADKKYYIKI